MTETLEHVMKKPDKDDLEKKISPIIGSAMSKILGVNIGELNKDITDRLKKRPTLSIKIDTNISFQRAKTAFKRNYIIDLLMKHHGNVSEVAKIAGINRRTIHRIVSPSAIQNIRKEMPKPSYIMTENISSAIAEVLEHYKKIIHPEKFREVYSNVPEISKHLLEFLEEEPMTLQEAEDIFEKEYLENALEKYEFNILLAAKKIGIRYETTLRKMKEHGIKAK